MSGVGDAQWDLSGGCLVGKCPWGKCLHIDDWSLNFQYTPNFHFSAIMANSSLIIPYLLEYLYFSDNWI